jgi:hypothetical protein
MISNKSIQKKRYENERGKRSSHIRVLFIDSFKEIGALYGKSLLDIDLLNVGARSE